MNKMAVLNYLETPFKTGSKEGPMLCGGGYFGFMVTGRCIGYSI